MTIEEARKLRKFIEKAALSLTDADALNAVLLYPEWKPDTAYAAGDRIRYNGKLYKVIQAHTSQADWRPNELPALYSEVAPEGVIPVWVQPTGAQDAYMTGDKVHYPAENDPIYESLIDNNVWSPTDNPAGWKML